MEFRKAYINSTIFGIKVEKKKNHSKPNASIWQYFTVVCSTVFSVRKICLNMVTYAVTLNKASKLSCLNFLICKEKLNTTIYLTEIVFRINETLSHNMFVMVWEGRFIILNKFLALIKNRYSFAKTKCFSNNINYK